VIGFLPYGGLRLDLALAAGMVGAASVLPIEGR
jgi:hypothetical protein